MIDLSLPRAALFDWDNTLVDNWGSIQAALNAALTDAGRAPFDMETVREVARLSARESFPTLFGQGWMRARDIFYAHFEANHLAGLTVLSGAEAALDAFRAACIPLGIVSNKKGPLLRREVAYLGWADRFMAVVGALDAAADKPDPAPVRLALSGGNIPPGPDVWVIGDTDVDLRAARGAGCVAILIGPGPADPRLLAGVEPDFNFRDCVALAGFVQERNFTISLGR